MNLAERMNEEIRRRQRVIRIFPNKAAAERLVGALLIDKHEEWIAGVKYFDMKECWDHQREESRVKKAHKKEKVVKIN